MAILAISLAIATAVPLVSFYVIHKLDLYRTGSFRLILLCFAWGAVVFALATQINNATLDYQLVTYETFQRFTAPIVEETLKALILVYLVRRPNFTYFVDGAIYGFAVGIGFAIVENYSYILGYEGTALSVAVGRVLSTNLMHATASALVGIALGFARFQRLSRGALLLLSGLLLAMAVHMAFNNLVTRVSSALLLLYAAATGLGGAAFTAFAIRRGLAEEKTWIEETLGEADRVTAGEAAVVHRLADARQILAPVAERFGPEKTAEIERFLLLQARLGILRKTLEKLTEEKMIRAVEAQMSNLQVEMDAARRSVGAYCMLYLRNIFPPEASPLWDRLEHAIEEKMVTRPVEGGMNLWATLGERTTQAGASHNGDDGEL
jgi:RsiW-degrading membrane proteinase PrsW (M82 family)